MSKAMLNRLVPIWDSLAVTAQGVNCTTMEDRETFRKRAYSEGIPFLTDQLAGLGAIFLRGIRNGFVTKEDFAEVRFELKEGSTLPVFLYSAWSKVFRDDGNCVGAVFEQNADGCKMLKSYKPPIVAGVAVRWLRQLTVVFGKLQLPHDKTRVKAVIDRFRANESVLAQSKGRLFRPAYHQNVRLPYGKGGSQPVMDVVHRARRLISRLLCNVDPRNITPRHGSGASACKTRPWERYDRILFDPEINTLWPWLEFACAGVDHCDQLLSAEFITNGYPKLARGVLVPKDYRGPRLISCEPATSMYYQQGLMTLLVEHLETNEHTRSFVNFTNQRINQVLAREGSVTRKLATLDLKDASDLLSWDLVVLLWPVHWLKALRAVRSKVTEIDDPIEGKVKVPLRKHAPMGSAVCFPVMALTIWALIKTAQVTPGRSKAWIYGDDIVVASDDAPAVIDLLTHVGLAVNVSKSFFGPTPFRESCGKEYWDGSDVTPVYCRYNPSDDDTELASLCSFANNIALSRGTCSALDTTLAVKRLTGVPIIGCSDERAAAWYRESDLWALPNGNVFEPNDRVGAGKPAPHLLIGPEYLCERKTMRRRPVTFKGQSRGYHSLEYRVRRPYPVHDKVEPSTWGYVLRSSLIGGDLGFTNSVALAKRVVYKYGWVALDW